MRRIYIITIYLLTSIILKLCFRIPAHRPSQILPNQNIIYLSVNSNSTGANERDKGPKVWLLNALYPEKANLFKVVKNNKKIKIISENDYDDTDPSHKSNVKRENDMGSYKNSAETFGREDNKKENDVGTIHNAKLISSKMESLTNYMSGHDFSQLKQRDLPFNMEANNYDLVKVSADKFNFETPNGKIIHVNFNPDLEEGSSMSSMEFMNYQNITIWKKLSTMSTQDFMKSYSIKIPVRSKSSNVYGRSYEMNNKIAKYHNNQLVLSDQAGCQPRVKCVELEREKEFMKRNYRKHGTMFWPSCIEIERCSGCCLHACLSCTPVETSLKEFMVLQFDVILREDGPQFNVSRTLYIRLIKHEKCDCNCNKRLTPLNAYSLKKKDANCSPPPFPLL
ncbi:uncharacterized protein LOC135931658 isoform X2 [Gordionus sp. m RMFG-2023]|uniref:uncharacterized protein LOC135931658 isoform X2 n=1 Tax=Gordionus sp. m RMFG-2023 TaxID=3053472 RepID=UPI0031FD8EB0